jgi:cellulose synthase/poly-beta-1,6-N-acetylglucosamine synthase-like glycosyltransferase
MAVYHALGRLQQSGQSELLPVLTVIIAARNEQNRILPCLQHLEGIDYPPEQLEIILIDDNSRDSTPDIIGEYCAKHSNWKLIRLSRKKPQLSGKKNALMHGLAAAGGEIIFVTDADCRVPRLWLQRMVRYFRPEVSMVLGYSPLLPEAGFWNKFLRFDNLFSAIVIAAPAKLGYPFSGAGRNMAYRRYAYNQVGGYQALKKFRSGDDMHLTERFRSKHSGRIDFSADPDTFVFTRSASGWREIFDQQIRKNSKVLKATPGTVIFFILLFCYYISIPLLPVSDPGSLAVWGLLLFLKLLLEWFCLVRAAKIFKQELLLRFIPLLQILYPFFIIFFSGLGLFQKYNWKN